MPHNHVHVHNATRKLARIDPTRTKLIRKAFEREIGRRIALLKRDVWDFMVTLDALALGERNKNPLVRLQEFGDQGLAAELLKGRAAHSGLVRNVQPREFEFRSAPDKLRAFREWLQAQIEARVISPRAGDNPRRPWTYRYLESAYRRGLLNAYIAAKKGEADIDRTQEQFLRSSFGAPETTAKIELLATRAFEDLKGVTQEMATQMNRVLAQGVVDGKNPREIAREMVKRVDGLTKKRALLIAQTEVINAHAEGQLDGFEELGIDDLGVMAEWSTAGDDRVCPRCAEMEGKKFTVEEARGLIPLHPRCRCSWIPYVGPPPKKKKVRRRRR